MPYRMHLADCDCALAAALTLRPILYEMNNVLFGNGRGNEEFANLPRKLNICISPTRDDFPHTQVSSMQHLGLDAVRYALQDPALMHVYAIYLETEPVQHSLPCTMLVLVTPR
eukprot:GHUV01047348.1.p2 GENE.GHUV01047348.1~~GHUV01047348.1.p2  ORF type:complete len:113 (+),score=31.80 GHUV01047348.1:319-657(+)